MSNYIKVRSSLVQWWNSSVGKIILDHQIELDRVAKKSMDCHAKLGLERKEMLHEIDGIKYQGVWQSGWVFRSEVRDDTI